MTVAASTNALAQQSHNIPGDELPNSVPPPPPPPLSHPAVGAQHLVWRTIHELSDASL